MSDVPVVPEVKEQAKRSESKATAPTKKPAVRKKAAEKLVTKKAVKKPQQKVGRASPKKASARKPSRKAQRTPFPYARVLKLWRAGKSSMEIAKAIDRYDSKAADPMHAFRVTLNNADDEDGIWNGEAATLAEEFGVSEDEAHSGVTELCDRRLIEQVDKRAYAITNWPERRETDGSVESE